MRCFTSFATDVWRFGDGGIFIGNLRRPINEVIPILEKAHAIKIIIAFWTYDLCSHMFLSRIYFLISI